MTEQLSQHSIGTLFRPELSSILPLPLKRMPAGTIRAEQTVCIDWVETEGPRIDRGSAVWTAPAITKPVAAARLQHNAFSFPDICPRGLFSPVAA